MTSGNHQENTPSATGDANATSAEPKMCDAIVQSTGAPCGKPALWRVIYFAGARMVLYRCERHLSVLVERCRGTINTLDKERLS
jgi:hypothetical protein